MRDGFMRRRRQGFTLIELVVVVAILAALAGLVVSKVDFLRRQATMAVAADTSGDVGNNIQMYLTTNSALPSGLDSLVDATTGGLYPHLIGTSDAVGSLPTSLTVVTIPDGTTDKSLNSLVRMGMSFINDHNDASTNATDSATIPRSLANNYIVTGSGTTASPYAGSYVVPTGNSVAPSYTTAGKWTVVIPGKSIWNAVYPPAVWGNAYSTATNNMVIDSNNTTVSLVALGVGPGNSMNGVTMATPPQMPGPDSNLYYYRYLAIFAVYSDGRRAQLKEVVDSFGRTVDSALSNYSTAAPDDVPPNSRTPE